MNVARPKLLLDLKRARQRDQRQHEPARVLQRHHHEHDVRGEQQEGVQDVRGRVPYQNCQGDDSGLLVRLQVARVVAVQDGLGVEGEGDGVEHGGPFEVAGLRHEGKQHGDGAEDDEDEDVTECDVLQADAARVEKAGGEAAKVDQGQVLHFGRGQRGEEDEADAARQVEDCT